MDVVTAIAGIRSLIDFTKTAVAARDDHKIAEVEQRLTRVLIDVQDVCLDLQQRLAACVESERAAKEAARELESEVQQLKRKADDRDRYQLAEPHPGTFILELANPAAAGEPFHRICQGCMDNLGKKVVLQGSGEFQHCPECNTVYRMQGAAPRRKLNSPGRRI